MNADDELRARLARLERGVEPDLERHYTAVLERASRRRAGASVGVALRDLAITAAVLLVLFTGFALRGTGPASQPPRLDSVVWTATLAPTDPDVAREGLAGTWRMTFGPSGSLSLTAPPTYLAPTTGYRYRVDDGRIVIGLFAERCAGTDPGVYTFTIDGSTLRLTAVEDACPHRLAFLTAGTWRVAAP
jgi:hypothetical protein